MQREKDYPFQILEKKADGELEKLINTTGKIVWYLSKEFQEKDMIYLGIQFEDKIPLPQSIITQQEVNA